MEVSPFCAVQAPAAASYGKEQAALKQPGNTTVRAPALTDYRLRMQSFSNAVRLPGCCHDKGCSVPIVLVCRSLHRSPCLLR